MYLYLYLYLYLNTYLPTYLAGTVGVLNTCQCTHIPPPRHLNAAALGSKRLLRTLTRYIRYQVGIDWRHPSHTYIRPDIHYLPLIPPTLYKYKYLLQVLIFYLVYLNPSHRIHRIVYHRLYRMYRMYQMYQIMYQICL